ncbi:MULTISPECIES: DUF1292 domain-containing protein [Clostridium]|uniref:DUF1292 domain-containing protein n=2 Tax=Clostridium TaxID=1485 RepID=A0A151ALB9_9CLOT|nr:MULTISPECIES: DUF1292 domain-containing protein [Clostridium]KYH28425.1 hypothetical protein CLCOL_19170 [Clostridium colicanis DSM 13634]MBE6043454.1 DUF1292 domain-containing protein [Clostridium thermopalmarium]PRR75695.1 hypothetical protein CPAL_05260 [Clostridium thermopalmarium DSM 5974]PVZ26618.1 uncharacterized protein DUF1292 [Clostridium thermopalmarium DSM 5974]
METQQTITVTNEFGKKVELELVDRISIGKDTYVIVAQPGADTANAYREVSRKNGMIEYASIGSGAEFQRVLKAYNEKNS